MRSKIEWRSVAENPPREENGLCVIYAKSADPTKPFYQTGWWNNERKRWDLVIDYWSERITHCIPLKDLGEPSKPR